MRTRFTLPTKRGRYAAADADPYIAGQSGLGALIIPGWAQAGGREAMLKRFADPRGEDGIATIVVTVEGEPVWTLAAPARALTLRP